MMFVIGCLCGACLMSILFVVLRAPEPGVSPQHWDMMIDRNKELRNEVMAMRTYNKELQGLVKTLRKDIPEVW